MISNVLDYSPNECLCLPFPCGDNNTCKAVEHHDFAEIEPGLFLGNCTMAADFESLKSKGISHIINCTTDMTCHHADAFTYLCLPLEDSPGNVLTPYLSRAIAFIKNGLASDGKIFIHCEQGISRSASVMVAYLMNKHRAGGYAGALKTIQLIYPKANPNFWFKKELMDFYISLFMSSTETKQIPEPTLSTSLLMHFRAPEKTPFMQSPANTMQLSSKKWTREVAKTIPWTVYRKIRGEGLRDQGYFKDRHWGKSGAGALILSPHPQDPQILLFKRALDTASPGQWSILGGARKYLKDTEEFENAIGTVIDEMIEEAGSLPRGHLFTDSILYQHDETEYRTYVLEIAFKEYYEPRLNQEHTEWKWFSSKKALTDPTVHPGVKFALNQLLTAYQQSTQSEEEMMKEILSSLT